MQPFSEEDSRPDALLKAIQSQEEVKRRGRLKIFLGMAAGVGKTYAMLEAAQALKKQGVDVIVGVVNTHGRQETAALLEGLTIIPEKEIEYKGVTLKELDLDEVLRLKPQLVLVDELAHTNVPGSRHPKRWQDVEELLEHQIDVYTTLNVQHIESLKDVVEGIADTKIRETVPDTIIEAATFIEVIDLTPNELLQRLKEGKVYLGDKSVIAAQNFFQEDRLTALREIILRYAAEKVDRELQGMVSTAGRATGWKPRERLLVAVSHSPHSKKLIRTTRRLAGNLNAPWLAVHVDAGHVLNEDDSLMLAQNLALARDLGAEVVTIHDAQITEAIEKVARQRGVTQIIVGRPPKRSFFSLLQRAPLLDRLAIDCRDIDIHVIRQEALISKYHKRLIAFASRKQFYSQASSYVWAFLSVCLLTAFNWFALPYVGYPVTGVFFLMTLLLLSFAFKRGPVLLASFVYLLTWNLFLLTPDATPIDQSMLLLYILIALGTGILFDRVRLQNEVMARREETTEALYEIVRQIASAPSLQESLKLVKERLERSFGGTFEIAMKKMNNGLDLDSTIPLITDDKEKSALLWVFEHGKEAGWSTDTLPLMQNLYLPLHGFRQVVGVLIYRPRENRLLTPDEKNFLSTVCQQLGHYIERLLTEEKGRQDAQRTKIDTMHTMILKRILHGFESPLFEISQAAEVIKQGDNKVPVEEAVKIALASQNLSKTLANITALIQLSEGLIPLKEAFSDVSTVIQETCSHLKKTLAQHRLTITVEDNIPPVQVDASLMQILLLNLINNAVENSPPQSTIAIEAAKVDGYVAVAVLDEGKGIPDDQLEMIFEKFYRLPETTTPGVGLGLAVAKTIAEVHHGHLKAENRLPQGAKFSFLIPLNTPGGLHGER